VRKRPIKVFKDWKVRKAPEIFQATFGSFRKQRKIHNTHKTHGGIAARYSISLGPEHLGGIVMVGLTIAGHLRIAIGRS